MASDSRLTRLKRLSKRLGGEIKELTSHEFKSLRDKYSVIQYSKNGIGFSEAPFTNKLLGLDYANHIVYVGEECSISGIIHEMGHAFACQDPPDISDEFDFFGWEYLLAKKLGIEADWQSNNKDYGLGCTSDLFKNQGLDFRKYGQHLHFRELDEADLETLLSNRITVGKQRGIIGPRGEIRSLLRTYKSKSPALDNQAA